MRDLTNVELLEINGGAVVPHVSNDSAVQSGYNLGYRIGRAVGQTIEDCGILFREVKSWF
jgi:hypothetical protein